METDNDKTKRLLEAGVEIFGTAVGSAIGLVGGPIGAIGGGVAGVVISKALAEFAQRLMSGREQARVGAALTFTSSGIATRVKNGNELRNDDFFNTAASSRSHGEELLEGVLLKCRDEYEERKIRFISKLFENVAFDQSVSPANANQVLNTSERLTYRQLTIMSLIGQNDKNRFRLSEQDPYDSSGQIQTEFSEESQFVLQDFMNLYTDGLIYRNDNSSLLDFTHVIPGKMVLTPIGKKHFNLLGLDEITIEELNPILQHLR